MLVRTHPGSCQAPMSWMLSTQWFGMASNMNMCNSCSRIEPNGEVPATELKVIAEACFLLRPRHQACVCQGQALEQHRLSSSASRGSVDAQGCGK